MHDFLYAVDQPYERKINKWSTNFTDENSSYFSTKWEIHSTQEVYPKIGEIPIEILEKYPSLNLIDLKLYQTTLYLESDSYSKFLFKTFGPNEQEFDVNFIEKRISFFED